MKPEHGAKEHTPALHHSLRQFELAEANLAKLELLWQKIEGELPDGLCCKIRLFGDVSA